MALDPSNSSNLEQLALKGLSAYILNLMELNGLPSTVMPSPDVTLTFDLLTPPQT